MNNETNSKRITINLANDAAELLKFLAESQNISQNEALRKAIATEAYFLKERQNGNKFLIQRNDEIREVIFR